MSKLFNKLNKQMEVNSIKNIQESAETIKEVEKKVLFENYVSNLVSDLENTEVLSEEEFKDGEQK